MEFSLALTASFLLLLLSFPYPFILGAARDNFGSGRGTAACAASSACPEMVQIRQRRSGGPREDNGPATAVASMVGGFAVIPSRSCLCAFNVVRFLMQVELHRRGCGRVFQVLAWHAFLCLLSLLPFLCWRLCSFAYA